MFVLWKSSRAFLDRGRTIGASDECSSASTFPPRAHATWLALVLSLVPAATLPDAYRWHCTDRASASTFAIEYLQSQFSAHECLRVAHCTAFHLMKNQLQVFFSICDTKKINVWCVYLPRSPRSSAACISFNFSFKLRISSFRFTSSNPIESFSFWSASDCCKALVAFFSASPSDLYNDIHSCSFSASSVRMCWMPTVIFWISVLRLFFSFSSRSTCLLPRKISASLLSSDWISFFCSLVAVCETHCHDTHACMHAHIKRTRADK